MKSLIYRLAGAAAWYFGHGRRYSQESIAFLMLHGVHDKRMAQLAPPPSNSMDLEGLMGGVRALRRHYNIISLDRAAEILQGRLPWEPRSIVLTFDDSLQCLLPTAATWLASEGVTATFYLSTEVIETQKPYWWKRLERAIIDGRALSARYISLPGNQRVLVNPAEGSTTLAPLKKALKLLPGDDIERTVSLVEMAFAASGTTEEMADPYSRILTWPQVRELAALGMTIGSHTVSHPNLTQLTPEQLRKELEDSRTAIQSKAKTPCSHLCYPYGACNEVVIRAAEAAGYTSAVTTEDPGRNSPGASMHSLRRYAMPELPERAVAMLSGVTGFRR